MKKDKEKIQKFMETGDSRYIYHNKLDKTCFQHDMTYEDFKDLTTRTLLIKYCVKKHLILLKIQNMMHINIAFFDKKSSGSGIKNENTSNKELAEELHNQLLKEKKSTLFLYK